jgi:hypothetical protein
MLFVYVYVYVCIINSENLFKNYLHFVFPSEQRQS